MGLSADEQQVLDSIEDAIAGSDPRLASLLGTFARLTAGEELPVQEQIRSAGRRAARRPGTRRWRPPWSWRPSCQPSRGRRGWQLVWPLVWLTVSVALAAVALVINHSEGGGTCTVQAFTCAGQAPAHTVRPAAPMAPAGRTLSTSG